MLLHQIKFMLQISSNKNSAANGILCCKVNTITITITFYKANGIYKTKGIVP